MCVFVCVCVHPLCGQVDRIGPMHQAGSDSLLTSHVFFKLLKVYFSEGVTEVLQNMSPFLSSPLVFLWVCGPVCHTCDRAHTHTHTLTHSHTPSGFDTEFRITRGCCTACPTSHKGWRRCINFELSGSRNCVVCFLVNSFSPSPTLSYTCALFCLPS